MNTLKKIRINDDEYVINQIDLKDIEKSSINGIRSGNDCGTVKLNGGSIDIHVIKNGVSRRFIMFICVYVDRISEQDINKIYFIDDNDNKVSLHDICLILNMTSEELKWEKDVGKRKWSGFVTADKGWIYENVSHNINKYYDGRVKINFTIYDNY